MDIKALLRCGGHCGEDMPGVTIHCYESCCHGRPHPTRQPVQRAGGEDWHFPVKVHLPGD